MTTTPSTSAHATLETARRYYAKGMPVIPVGPDKRALCDWKHLQGRMPALEELEAIWAQHSAAHGCALILGRGSNLVRLDLDGMSPDILQEFGGEPDGPHFATPSGGHGYLLRWESWLSTAVLHREKGPHQELRLQSDGAYTVLPPTPNYLWLKEDVPAARASREILGWYAERELQRGDPNPNVRSDLPAELVLDALNAVPPDVDYDDWLYIGMGLKNGGFPVEVWAGWSARGGKYKPGECEAKWGGFNRSGRSVGTIIWLAKNRYDWKPPKGSSLYEPLTELGNSRVLARKGVGKIAFCPDLKRWLAWDGCRWDKSAHGKGRVQEMQKNLLQEARSELVDSKALLEKAPSSLDNAVAITAKDRLIKAVKQCEKAAAIAGARALAESDPLLEVHRDRFDQKPELLNFRNGTVDLRTGALRPHDPADNITALVPHAYTPDAPRAMFDAALAKSVPDPDVQEYLRLKLGSMLLGRPRKEVLILWGPDGDNGKTMLMEMMLDALGRDYAVKCDRRLIMQSREGEIDRHTKQLEGMRFAGISETNEGARLNEALLKEIAGLERINTRGLFQERDSFLPQMDLMYVTNHKPVVSADQALWNRIKLVEFPHSFPPGHPDRVEGLKERLLQEMEGFLAWLVGGCRDYLERGLDEPAAVQAAIRAYKQEEDSHLFSRQA